MTTNAREEAAARAMAAAFDYPWEPMPEQGRENMRKSARAVLAAADGVAAGNWEGADEWMPLAWELCANECGEEACTELIWEGGPIPEPWGDRWLKYEDQAKEMIALVRKHATSPAHPNPAQGVSDERATFEDAFSQLRGGDAGMKEFGWHFWKTRAALAKFGGGVPEGWLIEPAQQSRSPFKGIHIKAPNGFATVVYSHARNPESILYMLAAAMLAAAPQPDDGAGREGGA